MPTPRRDAIENRESLIAAARTELDRDLGASLETIAASAGLSRRAVYGHFATRDDLIREVVTRGGLRVAAALEAVRDADPVVELARIASGLWHEVEHVRVMSLFAVRGPHVAQLANALAPLRARVKNLIVAGQKSGAVRTDIPAPVLARLVEEGALSVLDAGRSLSSDEGDRLAMSVVLSLLGFDWERVAATVAELRS